MLRKNNSNPAICVNNLIQITRGEVPYERVKGISSAHIDTPFGQATDEVIEDADWMLSTYEPRAAIDSIEVTPTDSPNGHFAITAHINTKEAEQ